MTSIADITKRPVSLDDLQRVCSLSSAALSADGSMLAYNCTSIRENDSTRQDLVIVIEPASGRLMQQWEGSMPQWSPVANEIAYLRYGEGEAAICIRSVGTNHERQVAVVYESHYFMGHLSTKNFLWSPDGSLIAFVSAGNAGTSSAGEAKQLTPGGTAETEAVSNISKTSAKEINRLLYKTRGGGGRPAFADDLLSHVWVVAVDGGQPRLLTNTHYNEHSICWSPDSQHIAFVSNRSNDPDNNQLHDLWTITVATGKTTRYTEHFGTVYQPVWSPDGTAIAFLGTTGKVATNDSPAEDTHLYIVHVKSGLITGVATGFDRRIELPAWHHDGRSLFFTAGDRGTTAIYQISPDQDLPRHIIGTDCQVYEYALSRNSESICFINTNSVQPSENFIYNVSTAQASRITNYTNLAFKDCHLSKAETFWFDSSDEKKIQGWIIPPAKQVAAEKYPLALVIHGGPHNMFGHAFDDRMQYLSANGFGVLYINPRGSSGYGQDFSNGCVLNWGGGDYQDLMAGVDAAIRLHDWIDAGRLVVTGQSYGGFMTNWIITQTNRFKAAVSDGGISNLVSFAGTSLYHSLIESEFNGSAYDNFDLLWKWSPIQYVKNVSTPTLFLHGEQDNEVPVTQAEEMYIALKKLGIETSFVQYLGEGHGWRPDLSPENRRDLLSRTINWFKKYLNY